MGKITKKIFNGTIVGVTTLGILASPGLIAGQVVPDMVDSTLAPGESMVVEKTVTTPTIPPKPDIYFLADTTGSMGPAIAGVQADAAAVLAAIDGSTTDPRYGAGDYKDFPFDAYAFLNVASIPGADDDGAAALAAIGGWAAGGGSDGSEGQFYALDQIASGVVGWRPDSTKIVVWFGDAPAHDPVCSAISGLGYDITEASLTAKLVAAGVKVIAISTPTSFFGAAALDADPTISAGDYVAACGAPGGLAGQATRIAAATGGVYLVAATPDDIADAILDGLESLKTDVWGVSSCDAGLNVTLAPAVHEDVPGGTTVNFTETISVDASVPEGSELHCTVTFFANSYPEEGAVIGEEMIWIKIPDRTPPKAECVETVNPHGQTVPPAGKTTLPGPKGGQNEDGFYELLAEDNLPGVEIWVKDTGSGTLFGPFASGTKIKYIEANGATPSQTAMGGNNGSGNGQSTAVDWKIKGTGDAAMIAIDAAGNKTEVSCLVPPPPK